MVRESSTLRQGAGEALALEACGLWAGYDGQPALEDVTFSIETGCLAGLVGPNGSGKSTLLRVILGLHRPWRGDVRVFADLSRSINELTVPGVFSVPEIGAASRLV